MAETPPEVFATTAPEPDFHATIEHDSSAGAQTEPTLLGFAPFQWVALAMLALILVAIVWGKVHRALARGLDDRIAAIREQLDEAKSLRAEAEALRDEYAVKIANAEQDATAMLDHARAEAASIVAKAEGDAAAIIVRREKMAEDKISAAERTAIEELQTRAAEAAAAAARGLIAGRHDAAADRELVDQVIGSL